MGQFHLVGLPPAPVGEPQIEVSIVYSAQMYTVWAPVTMISEDRNPGSPLRT